MPRDDPHTEIKLVDFHDAESLLLAIEGSTVVFCTVGTTNKKVKGDKEAYRKVDYDIPVRAARFSKMTGCNTFIMVSAVGANAGASNFYLRLKGETENAVKEVGLRSLHFMRPSMLMGPRKESRPGEKIGQGLMNLLDPILFWPAVRRYKSISAREVAQAMLTIAKDVKPGVFIYEFDDIRKITGQPK
jgi:uncharacterized protein YbjT (DUF2867 family)